MRRAFTLTELMVAVAVLVVVIVATSKIFGTASHVAGVGHAGTSVLQEATSIEQRIRADVERLSREAFFAIRCVRVPNDVNLASGGSLLDPSRPASARIRADQLVLFTQGVESVQTVRGWADGGGINRKGQGTATRVYCGPAFQVPAGPPADTAGAPDVIHAIDPPVEPAMPLTPWTAGQRTFQRIRFQRVADDATEYTSDGPYGTVDVTQPPAPKWLLARQAVVLIDDGGMQSVALRTPLDGGVRTAPSIWMPFFPGTVEGSPVVNGRVDAAASLLSEIRFLVNAARPWMDPTFVDGLGLGDQFDLLGNAVFYPRAERTAPSTHRVDAALTTSVIGTACSSFTVDWTWFDGAGFTENPADPDAPYRGVRVDPALEQPWFGINDVDRAVRPFRSWVDAVDPAMHGDPIFFENVEPGAADAPRFSGAGAALRAAGAEVYEAFFGYNESVALNGAGLPDAALGYTPWPSAIRVTMTLRDAKGRLEAGRVVQFVIDLPERR